jgi:hypothetical protein
LSKQNAGKSRSLANALNLRRNSKDIALTPLQTKTGVLFSKENDENPLHKWWNVLHPKNNTVLFYAAYADLK